MYTQSGCTPLQLACHRGHMDIAVMLKEKGANPTAEDDEVIGQEDKTCVIH